jgi:predicted ATPase
MRLESLQITDFKNLRDFSIAFDKESLTSVVVGKNGTGKSNLIEALVIIFRDLDLGAPPTFAYRLSYTCRGRYIEIDADPQRTKDAVQLRIDKEPLPYRALSDARGRECLPRNVFGYYSGPTNRLESLFDKHQDKFYRALLAGEDNAMRPLFYARMVHSQFVLLAFFSSQDSEAQTFLRDYLGIEGLESVLFVMKQPPWKSKVGDPRFWNARGVVSGFLDNLYRVALAPLRLSQKVSLGLGRSTTLDHLYLYLPDIDSFKQLVSTYANQAEFFKTLESTYISELIKEVRIRVRLRKVGGTLTFRELSEGEQQLLMVLGLLRFTKDEESLFLLDEPDTHLNPAWSINYLNLLKMIVGDQQTSHIILASHDPLLVAGLNRSQVRVMRRNEETARIRAEMPEEDPKGMGVAGVLTSELFGLRSSVDLETLQKLDRKRELASKESLTSEEKQELEQISEAIANLDFTKSVRDPLYKPFVRAMVASGAYQDLKNPVLTPEEQKKQRELATQILEGLRKSSKK